MIGSAGGAPSPVTGLALRCSACGAAYKGSAGREVLTCDYCGTAQRLVDAREFLDHLVLQVNAFLSQALPGGFVPGGSGVVDPIARHSVFVNNVRPRLTTEADQYRFRCFNLLSQPLLELPFSSNRFLTASDDPKQIALFGAKVSSVSSLAIDGDSQAMVTQTGHLATGYGCLLVAIGLLRSRKPERFHLLDQNFQTAAEAFRPHPRWAGIADRLAGLSEASRAADEVRAGRVAPARELLMASEAHFRSARAQLDAQFELGFMIAPIEEERSMVRSIRSMTDALEATPRDSNPPALVSLERLHQVLDHLGTYSPPAWDATFRSARLREEVFRGTAELRRAQHGSANVRHLRAGAGVLVPFWIVELPYSFQTGVLWNKRGQEVAETVLVAATFPLEPRAFSGAGASLVVTDVFGAGLGAGGLADFYARVRGSQTTISTSGPIPGAVHGSAPGPVPGWAAIPPITTAREALSLTQVYVESVKAGNPKIAAQLRLSSPRVGELLYLPCVLDPRSLPLPWLGPLSPRTVGAPESLLALAA